MPAYPRVLNRLILIAGKDPLLEIGGGHGSYVRAHARAAIRAGYEPEILCVSRSTGVVHTDYGAVHRLRSPTPIGGLHGLPRFLSWVPVHVPLLARAVAARLRSGRVASQPVIVHGFGAWASAGALLPRRLAVAIASMYTVTEHEYGGIVRGLTKDHRLTTHIGQRWKRFWTRRVVHRHERRACERSAALLVNYDSVRRLLGDAFGPAVAARCRRVPYSCESAFLDAAVAPAMPPDPASPHVVSLSRHDARKGLDVLIRALASLRRDGVPFRATLVGGGRLLPAHRDLVSRLGLEDVVNLTGFVEDPRPWLASADVFVLPSLEEGGGALSLLEALSTGIAVVASRIDGIPEDVTDGADGLLVPPSDPDGLARAIGTLIARPDLRRRLAEAARRTFERSFSAQRFASSLGEIYGALSSTPARLPR